MVIFSFIEILFPNPYLKFDRIFSAVAANSSCEGESFGPPKFISPTEFCNGITEDQVYTIVDGLTRYLDSSAICSNIGAC